MLDVAPEPKQRTEQGVQIINVKNYHNIFEISNLVCSTCIDRQKKRLLTGSKIHCSHCAGVKTIESALI